MRCIVHFESAHLREQVVLHAWDPGGDIRDIAGVTDDHRHFRFDLEMDTVDPRNIAFKFWFPRQTPVWEPDDYTRHMPARAREIWTFDYSARCMTRAPGQGRAPKRVAINALTRARFRGGRLYLWRPGGDERQSIAETSRDDASERSLFSIPVEPWMKVGFHFKLVSADGCWEPDTSSRVWRPADGKAVWIKSGLVELYAERPKLTKAFFEIFFIRAQGPPRLWMADSVQDFQGPLTLEKETPYDADFAFSKYSAAFYPDAAYRITAFAQDLECLNLPYTLRSGQARTPSRAVAGVYQWLARRPRRDATLALEIHPNPDSRFGAAIQVAWRPGTGPRTARDTVAPAALTALARRKSGRTWKVKIPVFSQIPHWIDTLTSPDGLIECRPDGPTRSKRTFELAPGETRRLHTGDGIGGLGDRPPKFQDLDPAERRRWMQRAFTSDLVDGAFSPRELPHGATRSDGEWGFVLFAPHAVSVDLLLLEKSRRKSPRRTRTIPMRLTPDLRYWWCRVPVSALPVPEEIRYRFLLNGSQEVIDPASRRVSPAPWLWAAAGEGAEGPWSLAVDTDALRGETADGWQTPEFNDLIIYELHPLRFTHRHPEATAFERLAREAGADGYLAALGVNVLELLPIHEFPKDISWGYNPSCFFAIEQSYGGPQGLARLVAACHRQGQAVMLDLVYNHLVESPLQEVAADVFVDGETQWGDMVNYDHPMCREFFRQALLYLWDTFRLDGFRFDATEAIVNGHIDNGYIINNHRTGSGGGFEFLVDLKHSVATAADACGRRWPYLACENDPCNDGLLGPCMDGQWDFRLQYPLGEAAINREDKTPDLMGVLQSDRGLYQVVRYAESHDAVSAQEGWKQRMVQREAWGNGLSMAKAVGATALLAEGVPMLFMGEEAAEHQPFQFSMPSVEDPRAYLDLDRYLDPNSANFKVLQWFRHLIGLRRNPANGFAWEDQPVVGRGYKTLAFTRAGGKYFVIATFGTPDTRQNLGWLGLPGGAGYKEIFNSTWDSYRVASDSPGDNGGYAAKLSADRVVQLPPIGAVILERI